MDKLGPAYLMAKERAAERVNTLRMGLMLVFMDVVVGWAIGFQTIIASMCWGWAGDRLFSEILGNLPALSVIEDGSPKFRVNRKHSPAI